MTHDAQKQKIQARLAELQDRMERVDDTLDQPADADLNDQAIELEDDEVLDAIAAAAQKEVRLLQKALRDIEAGTYGICKSCDEPISPERLEAVPYALLCRDCASTQMDKARQSRG
jgi:DnaK suppressor protein